jgi:hypothetical protein
MLWSISDFRVVLPDLDFRREENPINAAIERLMRFDSLIRIPPSVQRAITTTGRECLQRFVV